MALLHTFIIGFLGFSFLYYGVSCLSSKFMVSEFERFGLSKTQRKITGIAQIIGGCGILTGFFYKPLQIVAVSGIALLMFIGWIVRLKIKDSFIASLPAFSFFVLCLYLTYYLVWIR